MKKLFLASIAALLTVSIRPVSAGDMWSELGTTIFDCGEVLVEHVHLSDMEAYRIEVTVEHKSRKRPPIVTFDAKSGNLVVNGKRCKPQSSNP